MRLCWQHLKAELLTPVVIALPQITLARLIGTSTDTCGAFVQSKREQLSTP